MSHSSKIETNNMCPTASYALAGNPASYGRLSFLLIVFFFSQKSEGIDCF